MNKTLAILTIGVIATAMTPDAFVAADQSPASPERVVLVSIAGARAGLADWKAVTPELTRCAENGVRFVRATTPTPHTFPATVSLLTGLLPSRTGVRNEAYMALDVEHRTLAEVFADAGYATAALPADRYCHALSGIEQGFESFVLDAPSMSDSARVDSALALAAIPGRQFVWLGLMFGEPMVPWHRYFGGAFPDSASYAARAGELDRQLGRLIRGLEGLDGRGATLIAVVGTHGESIPGWALRDNPFGEAALPGRGLDLADDALRVPFVLYGPGWLARRTFDKPWVSTIDVAPTLIAATGVSASQRETPGSGWSLWSHAVRGEGIPDRVLVHENDVVRSFDWQPRVAARLGGEKLIAYGDERRSFAAVGGDKSLVGAGALDEAVDPSDARRLEEAVGSVLASQARGRAPATEPTRHEALSADAEDACFVDMVRTMPGDSLTVDIDLVDRVGSIKARCPGSPMLEVHEATLVSAAGGDQSGATLFVHILEAHPDFPEAALAYVDHVLYYRHFDVALAELEKMAASPLLALEIAWRRAVAHAGMLDVDAAEAAFAKATAIGPPPGPSWQRSYEIAQRIIRAKRFVDEEPDRAPLRLAYGMALGDFGLFRDCFIQLHTARRLAPTDPEADYWMGRYLIAQGRPGKAIFAFERALEIDPQHVPALRGMAEAKFLETEIGDATQFLAQAVQLDPGDPTSRYNLACLLSLTGDAESALSELEAAIDLGYSNWDNVLHDPDLELVRTLPRYRQLRERAPAGVAP